MVSGFYYDADRLVQVQIAIDVSCFSYALRFAHTSFAGYNRLWGSSVSWNCSVIYNLKDSSDFFLVRSLYFHRIWIGMCLPIEPTGLYD